MNTAEKRVAYINAQVACAMIELEAMKQANRDREAKGLSPAYDDAAFMQLQVSYGIHHNEVVSYLREVD